MSREEIIRHHANVLVRDGFIKTAGAYEKTRFCTCCKEGFEYGQQYRTFTSHMHVMCISQLLDPNGAPKIVLDFKPPPRDGSTPQSGPKPPPAVPKLDADGLADKIADRIEWLREADTDVLIETIAGKVQDQIEPLIKQLQKTIDELKALVEEGA